MAVNLACSVAGDECTAPGGKIRRGLCNKHYKRSHAYGGTDPSFLKQRPRAAHGEPMAFVLRAVGHKGDDCLLWPYGTTPWGYGCIRHEGKSVHAHRLVLMFKTGGPPPDYPHAAHAPGICHNRLCVNPAHLRWATCTENSLDRRIDGTNLIGTRQPTAKLDDVKVRQIRKAAGPQRLLAVQFGVCQQTISDIKARRRWAWLPDEPADGEAA